MTADVRKERIETEGDLRGEFGLCPKQDHAREMRDLVIGKGFGSAHLASMILN